MNLSHPLMDDNITRQDIQAVTKFLNQRPIPKLTNGPKVREFEEAWSDWLGVKYSVFVNSGASANELTLLALKGGFSGIGTEVIVPPLTWISDIAAIEFAGFKPVFVDINTKNLSFDIDKLKAAVNENTAAIFVTHVLGINAITPELLNLCEESNIYLIEDVCESHGAIVPFTGQKCGAVGDISNFSFYFAHHMSTIEGGMICTNNHYIYNQLRALRSHGMIREMDSVEYKEQIIKANPELNPDFIFLRPAHNFRSTEINAVIGLNQLQHLDKNNIKRQKNYKYFMSKLDSSKYYTDIDAAGQSNYAFIVILKDGTIAKRDELEAKLRSAGIEFRRGLSGGGNQMLQPFIKEKYNIDQEAYPVVNYIHKYSWYVGNYPSLKKSQINKLLDVLNND